MKVALIGATGSIGNAIVKHYKERFSNNLQLYAFSRQQAPSLDVFYQGYINFNEAQSVQDAADLLEPNLVFDRIIVTTGLLHNSNISPEKSLQALDEESFMEVMRVNALGPINVAKYFVPKLARDKKSIFAALSARVGSIGDNQLGGWYSYRASKAALNMLIKNLSIEYRRRHKNMIFLGLHPGTVESALSAPFMGNSKNYKVFKPSFAAEKLVSVIEHSTTEQSGCILDWKGEIIEP